MSTLNAAEPTVVELKAIHDHAMENLRMLESARQTEEVKRGIASLKQVLSAVAQACGPTMIIPVHHT